MWFNKKKTVGPWLEVCAILVYLVSSSGFTGKFFLALCLSVSHSVSVVLIHSPLPALLPLLLSTSLRLPRCAPHSESVSVSVNPCSRSVTPKPQHSHNSKHLGDKSCGLNNGFRLPGDQITHSSPPLCTQTLSLSLTHTHTHTHTRAPTRTLGHTHAQILVPIVKN